MFNRCYGHKGQSIVLTQEDFEIAAAADDRDSTLREMVDGDSRDFHAMLSRGRFDANQFIEPTASAIERLAS